MKGAEGNYRSLFWTINKTMHLVSWLLGASIRHHPVLHYRMLQWLHVSLLGFLHQDLPDWALKKRTSNVVLQQGALSHGRNESVDQLSDNRKSEKIMSKVMSLRWMSEKLTWYSLLNECTRLAMLFHRCMNAMLHCTCNVGVFTTSLSLIASAVMVRPPSRRYWCPTRMHSWVPCVPY